MTVCNAEWYAKKLKSIEYWQYVGVYKHPNEPEYYGLLFAHPSGHIPSAILWIWRDDEGNGPGSVDLQLIEAVSTD